MPVPAAISDLSQTAGSNFPGGGESPTTADDYIRTLSSFVAQLRDGVGFAASAGVIPAGTLIDFAGTAAPTGYLACDGAAVSRATYAALFAAIGTTWGAGNGTTTFNVPNLARRTTIGSGGTAVAGPANTVGATGGAETHALSTAELAAHTHGVTDPGHIHNITDPGHTHSWAAGGVDGVNGAVMSNGPTGALTTSSTTGITVNSRTTGVTVNSAGSGTAHNNMQPSAVVMKCIKV